MADIFGIHLDLDPGPAPPPVPEPSASDQAPTTSEAITMLRERLGLTVLEFSGKLGVSAGSVYRWEAASGPLNLHRRNLKALARLQSPPTRR